MEKLMKTIDNGNPFTVEGSVERTTMLEHIEKLKGGIKHQEEMFEMLDFVGTDKTDERYMGAKQVMLNNKELLGIMVKLTKGEEGSVLGYVRFCKMRDINKK